MRSCKILASATSPVGGVAGRDKGKGGNCSPAQGTGTLLGARSSPLPLHLSGKRGGQGLGRRGGGGLGSVRRTTVTLPFCCSFGYFLRYWKGKGKGKGEGG